MTTPYLAADIGRDEGLRLHAYPDSDTGAEPWTIGYGCTGPDVRPGVVWTKAQADQALNQRIAHPPRHSVRDRRCAIAGGQPWPRRDR